MSSFQSIQYQRVFSEEEEEEDESSELPPTLVTTRGVEKNGRWNHIENLDDFFVRIYKYHQEQGFACLLLSDIFSLLQYIFIVLFTLFLAVCIDYKKLFRDDNPVFSEVTDFSRLKKISTGLVICVIVALTFWFIRLIKIIHDTIKAWEIRRFYHTVLRISENELQDMQWRDVQLRLMEVQKDHQMCIHKKELTELDIHHRILRRKNYFIALQNKGIVNCVYRFPVLGSRTFLTEGLKFNLSLMLFKGPGAPFEKSWKLKREYKDYSCRTVLANALSRRIFLLGLVNLIMCPFIFVYQVLHSFFTYAELVKRSPDVFGARRWSPYGRLYLRHFNELDHDFQGRLSKSYEPATKYMNSFMSPILTIFARNIAFFVGAILAVLLGLSFYDQDVLTAEHMISFMATLGIIIKVCAGFIPDENAVYNPEMKQMLMNQIKLHTHYIPGEWKGTAHTKEVREEFSRLFQYKIVHLVEELLSPLLTPFILCFHLPHKSQQIIDFYRNFTVDVTGVGDVCSFAQMDIRKHGTNKYVDETKEDQILSAEQQAENGKTELSLLHFSFKNPTWRPSDSRKEFIATIKEQAIQESLSASQSLNLQCLSNYGFPNPAYTGSLSTDYMSMQSPLQSLAQPVVPFPEMSLQQEQLLLNNSVMYLREVNERQRISLHNEHSNEADSIQHTWTDDVGRASALQQDGYAAASSSYAQNRWNEESQL